MPDPAHIPRDAGLPRDHAQAAISDSAALLEISTNLNASQDLEFILGNVLLTAMGKLMLSKAVVLIQGDDGTYTVRASKGVAFPPGDPSFHLPAEWHGYMTVDSLAGLTDPFHRAFIECCVECGVSSLLPVVLGERMVGVIGVGGKVTGAAFTSADITFLETLAAIAATAVNNALTIGALQASNRRLDSKIQELNTLFELSREMNATFEEQDILRVLGYVLMGQLRALRHAVFVSDGTRFSPLLVKLPAFAPDAAMLDALGTLRSMTVFSASRPPRTDVERWLSGFGVTVVVPMLAQNEVRGVLCLGERMGVQGFDAAEREYLAALANITITAVENARLFRETIEKHRLEKELSLARSIQKGMLPARIVQPEGYEIAAVNESSQQVGGDYYDVMRLTDDECVVAIGDVSGKGIPASLLMANVQAALRAIAPLRLPLPEATARLNAIVFGNTGADKFITFFWGVLHARAHTLSYVNCGHNPPYILSAGGSLRPLSTGGLILGVLETTPPYESETVELRPGDALVAYTDGVNEAMSRSMELYGDERLQSLLSSLAQESACGIIDRVRADIHEYTRGAPQSDDITMLTVKRLSW